MSGVDVDQDISCEVFTLEPLSDPSQAGRRENRQAGPETDRGAHRAFGFCASGGQKVGVAPRASNIDTARGAHHTQQASAAQVRRGCGNRPPTGSPHAPRGHVGAAERLFQRLGRGREAPLRNGATQLVGPLDIPVSPRVNSLDRGRFQYAAEDDFRSAVEQITGRKANRVAHRANGFWVVTYAAVSSWLRPVLLAS
jgi:hypothetical protein